MTKKALYVELPPKVVADSKRLATRLDIPMTKLVELALKAFIDDDPQLTLKFNNARTSRTRKIK